MTRESGTISNKPSQEPGAEYEALRAEAIAMVQTMAGDIWTDYNYSDPGVTIIEQLAYALTELPYRASLPVADILADPDSPRLQVRRHGLFPAWSILPCNPVTVADIRRLILDQIADIANIWIDPIKTEYCDGKIAGLYSVSILPYPGDHDRFELIEKVCRCYTAHRALCEDFGQIKVLEPERTVVEARIEIAHGIDPSDALAQSLFTLGLAFAPEPTRLPLGQWQELKPSTTEVFSGPLLLRGFITDDQLDQDLFDGTAHQLAELLAAIPDVLVVDSLKVKVGDHLWRNENDKIKAGHGRYLKLETTDRCWPDHHGFSITIYRDFEKCEPVPDLVHRKLTALWKEHRKTWPLRKEIAKCYGSPDGHYDDLASYTSVQTQFPAVFGVGHAGLFDGATTERKGQAKQLKGYLMPFDQLLADYFAQLAFVRTLFSVEAGGESTYAWQSLRPIVPNVAPLLSTDYESRLAKIVSETDPVTRRRNAILDLLLSFQGLALSVAVPSSPGRQESAASAAVEIKAKQVLLRRAAEATRDRGRGVDYLHHDHGRSMSGTEMMSRIELGLLDEELKIGFRSPDRWDNHRDACGRVLEGQEWRRFEPHFRSIKYEEVDESYRPPATHEPLLLNEELLVELHQAEDYQVGISFVDEVYVVIFRDSRGRWWIVAVFEDEAEALFIIVEIHRHARSRHRHRQSLYLVEWILLRHAKRHHDDRNERYNFRITAVVAAAQTDRNSAGWEEQVNDITRSNTPAHIAVECLVLEHRHLREFETLYFEWRRALRHSFHHSIAETSRRLEDFLLRHLPEPVDPCKPPAPPPTPAPSPPIPPVPPAPTPSPPVPCPPTPAPVPPDPDPDPPEEKWWQRLFHWIWHAVKNILWVLLKFITLGAIGVAIYELGKDIWAFLKRLFGGRLPQPPDEPEPPAIPPPSFPWFPEPPSAPVSPPPAPVPPAPVSPAPVPVAPTPSPQPTPLPSPPMNAGTAVAVVGQKGFDGNTVMETDSLAAFYAQGFRFAIRYVRNTDSSTSGNLSAAEAETIRSSGFALMAVQHVRGTGWRPTAELGQQDGILAVQQVVDCGLPARICVWMDLEGVYGDATSDDVLAYCNAWFTEVSIGGFIPGIYVGANCGLNQDQLDNQLPFEYYWRSGSSVPDLPNHGYCMVQLIDSHYVIDGVSYDLDTIVDDSNSKPPVWAAPLSNG